MADSTETCAHRHLYRPGTQRVAAEARAADEIEAEAIAAMAEPLKAAEKVADSARDVRRAIDGIFDPALLPYRLTLIQRHLDLQAEERRLRGLAEQRAAEVHARHRREAGRV